MRSSLIPTKALVVFFGLASSALVLAGLGDVLIIKEMRAKAAVLEGDAKSLKVGDSLYHTSSPFKFTITEIKGNRVTIALPENNQLGVNKTLLRAPTEAIQKALKTETRLKQALAGR